jgi:hypothetical protein
MRRCEVLEPVEIDITKLPVYWINLDEATERRKTMETMFEKHGFENVTRIPGIKHERGLMGCGFAFMEAFKQAPDCGFIIFEDDCVETENFTTKLKIPHNTDAFYLGISAWARYNGESGPYLRGQSVAPNTVRIANMLSAHAIYYRSRRYTEACKEALDLFINTHEDHHDIGFANIMGDFNVYCNEKPIVYQSSQPHVTKITLSQREDEEE